MPKGGENKYQNSNDWMHAPPTPNRAFIGGGCRRQHCFACRWRRCDEVAIGQAPHRNFQRPRDPFRTAGGALAWPAIKGPGGARKDNV